MNPLGGALVLGVAALACKELTLLRKGSVAPKDAYASVVSALTQLSASTDFVTNVESSYRIWPRGTVAGITYDGAICTFITPVPAKLAFSVDSYLFVKGRWEWAEGPVLDALELQRTLRRPDGTLLGVPGSVRRALAESHMHRRFVCGIEIASPPERPPTP